MIRIFALCLTLSLLASGAAAQTILPLDKIQNQHDLDQTITALDAGLFEAYNKCDLVKFASFIDEHIEFYHDQGGLTLGEPALTESVKKNICGTTTRELVPGTLQIYYMKGYGAVEIGVHRFHHPGHPEIGDGEGRFIHLWQYSSATAGGTSGNTSAATPGSTSASASGNRPGTTNSGNPGNNKDGSWKITRAISYDHHAATK